MILFTITLLHLPLLPVRLKFYDGSPWRPVIHVKDLCNAFISGIEAPKKLVSGESFNVELKMEIIQLEN